VVEHLGDFDFVYQGLLAVLLGKGCLFTEGLDRHLFLVSQVDAKVDCGEVALPQTLFGLEEFVEVELVHELLEFLLPLLDLFGRVPVKLLRVEVRTYKFYPCRSAEYLFFGFVLGPQDLENGIESNHEALLGEFAFRLTIKYGLVSEHKRYGGSVVRFEVESGAEYGVGR